MAEQVFEKHVLVCTEEKGPGIPSCAAAGGKALLRQLQSECSRAGLDGRVLVTGGRQGNVALASTEVFDPVANSFSPGIALPHSHSRSKAQTGLRPALDRVSL